MIRNKSIILNAGVRGTAAGLAFISQILLVKFLGKEAYGSYTLFVTFCSLIFIFSKSGLDIVALRNSSIAFDNLSLRSITSTTLKACGLALALSMVWTMAFQIASNILPHRLSQTNAPSGWVFGGVYCMTSLAILLSLIRGMRRIVTADAIDAILKPTLIIAILWTLSITHGNTSQSGYIAYVGSNLAVTIITAIFFATLIRRTTWNSVDNLSSTSILSIRTATTYITYAFISYIFFQLDTLLVGYNLGPTEAGAYNMACNFVRLVIFIPMIVVVQIQPSIASAFHKKNYALVREIVRGGLKRSITTAALCASALAIGGHWLLTFVSPSYGAMYSTLLVLAIAHTINSAILVITGAMLMCNAQRLVVSSQIAGLCVCAPLYFLLIPRLGTIGAAISVLAGLAANLISQSILFENSFKPQATK